MYEPYDLEDCVSPAKKAHAIDYLDEVSSALDWDMPYKPEHEDYLHKLLI